MAVFYDIRAFQNAAPIGLRLDPPTVAPTPIPSKLVGGWSLGADGRLVWRWRAPGRLG